MATVGVKGLSNDRYMSATVNRVELFD